MWRHSSSGTVLLVHVSVGTPCLWYSTHTCPALERPKSYSSAAIEKIFRDRDRGIDGVQSVLSP